MNLLNTFQAWRKPFQQITKFRLVISLENGGVRLEYFSDKKDDWDTYNTFESFETFQKWLNDWIINRN